MRLFHSLPVVFALLLTGCSPAHEVGAYESEIQQVREATESDFVRRVLADGVLSESEMDEMRSNLRLCLVDAGFEDVEFYSDGTFAVAEPEDAEAAYGSENAMAGERELVFDEEDADPVVECEYSSGFVELSALHAQMLVNPNNEDFDELAVQCLIESGAVNRSFSVADLEQVLDNPDGHTNLVASEEFARCNTDPLGLMPSESTEIEVR